MMSGRLCGSVLTVMLLLAFPTAGQSQEEILHYRVQEESDVGAFVGNVARDSQLYSRFSQDEFQQLQYSISSRNAKFTIDENTSTIRTGHVLDREVRLLFWCGDGARCHRIFRNRTNGNRSDLSWPWWQDF